MPHILDDFIRQILKLQVVNSHPERFSRDYPSIRQIIANAGFWLCYHCLFGLPSATLWSTGTQSASCIGPKAKLRGNGMYVVRLKCITFLWAWCDCHIFAIKPLQDLRVQQYVYVMHVKHQVCTSNINCASPSIVRERTFLRCVNVNLGDAIFLRRLTTKNLYISVLGTQL